MKVRQRINNIIIGILILICSGVMIWKPMAGYVMAALILIIGLVVYGIKTIIYFFTMARHMVGGRIILYKGVIALDLGILLGFMTAAPSIYMVVYMFIVFGFTGVITILRAFEAKKGGASWKFKFTQGLVCAGIGVCCVIFISNISILVYIFSAGLIYVGIVRIISAFRRSAIVYIQ